MGPGVEERLRGTELDRRGEGAVRQLYGNPDSVDIGDRQVVETVTVQVAGNVDPRYPEVSGRAVGRGQFRKNVLGGGLRIEPFDTSVAVDDEAVTVSAARHINKSHATAHRCIEFPHPVGPVESVELYALLAVFIHVYQRECRAGPE